MNFATSFFRVILVRLLVYLQLKIQLTLTLPSNHTLHWQFMRNISPAEKKLQFEAKHKHEIEINAETFDFFCGCNEKD